MLWNPNGANRSQKQHEGQLCNSQHFPKTTGRCKYTLHQICQTFHRLFFLAFDFHSFGLVHLHALTKFADKTKKHKSSSKTQCTTALRMFHHDHLRTGLRHQPRHCEEWIRSSCGHPEPYHRDLQSGLEPNNDWSAREKLQNLSLKQLAQHTRRCW